MGFMVHKVSLQQALTPPHVLCFSPVIVIPLELHAYSFATRTI